MVIPLELEGAAAVIKIIDFGAVVGVEPCTSFAIISMAGIAIAANVLAVIGATDGAGWLLLEVITSVVARRAEFAAEVAQSIAAAAGVGSGVRSILTSTLL